MEIPEKLKVIVFLIDRVGVPLLLCAFLSYIVFVKFNTLEKKMRYTIFCQKKIMVKLKIQDIPRFSEFEEKK